MSNSLMRVAAITALAAPASAGGPLAVYLDGHPVGTLDYLEYQIAAGRIDVHTNELVYGCRQDRLFRDRFERWGE